MVFERKKLGLFLREKRTQRGLSQSKVSDALGYSSPQFISNWERGVSAPPLKALSVLVDVYQIPKQELIDVIVKETVDILEQALAAPAEQKTQEQTPQVATHPSSVSPIGEAHKSVS